MNKFTRLYITHGFTAATLAARIGVTESAVHKYATGEILPRWNIVQKLCKELHCDTDTLLKTLRGDKIE